MIYALYGLSFILLGFLIYKNIKLEKIKELNKEFDYIKGQVRSEQDFLTLLKKEYDKYIQTLNECDIEIDNLKKEIDKYNFEAAQAYTDKERAIFSCEQDLNNYKQHIAEHKQELELDFQDFTKLKLAHIAKYDSEIAKMKKYVEDYNQEQIRKKQKETQQEFYKLELSDSAKQDVNKLITLSEELNSPDVLLKLIYKTYFEKPMNDLLTRVVGVNSEKSGVYKITNVLYDEAYIGQTVNFKDRWRAHLKKGLGIEAPVSNKFYQAMKKYKPWNFTFEVLAFCPKDELNETEKYWIDFYQTNKWGYNSKGGNQ